MSGHCEKCGNTQCICGEIAGEANKCGESGDNLCKGAGELKEALAEYAHHAWAGWMMYLFEKSVDGAEDGTVVIPAWAVERWMRQATTPYRGLPESEKESDRKEAEQIMVICSDATRAPQQAAKDWVDYITTADGVYVSIEEAEAEGLAWFARAPQQAAGEWVSVEGELPPEAKIARKPIELGWLVCDAVGKVYITKQHPTNWNTVDPRGYEFNGDPVSHWMPLPKPTANAGEAGDDQICKCAASSGNWFDRNISQRADGTEGMAYVCNDCGNEVSTAGEGRG